MRPRLEKKKKKVAELVKLIDQYNIIAVVDLENIPALQLMRMRASLRDKVKLIMTKKRLIKRAIDLSKKENIAKLKDYIEGMPAILFSNSNPFVLYKIIKQNKSKAPIKGGQKASTDIVVPAGPTEFAPGPIIGELGSVGIKAGIDAGKIAIKEDALVLKEGEVCSAKLASILTRLKIEPMEIGLRVTGVYENGEILTKDILDIDEEAYTNKIISAFNNAKNLAFEIAYPLKEIIKDLIFKAYTNAVYLGVEKAIVNTETIKELLSKAQASTMSILKAIPEDSLPEELKSEVNAAKQSAQINETEGNKKEEEKPKEKEKSPEDAAAGLGSLFG